MNHNCWRVRGVLAHAGSIFEALGCIGPHFLDCLDCLPFKRAKPRMPVSGGLFLPLGAWSSSPQDGGRDWTPARCLKGRAGAWCGACEPFCGRLGIIPLSLSHADMLRFAFGQPQLTNWQNQGGRTTIQTKWWWDLSLQHFGGIDFNLTEWNFIKLPSSGASRSVI